ncbi:transcriptional regulator [Vibrio splendidus]|nr:ROK family protein [Vibrio splendidus]PMO03799.1 transcriptional regulator [Vibrio splendidus]PTQ02762.1 transcriptional regulator [Vibrio splendidus]
MHYLGLDIGGTKIAAAIFQDDGEQLYYQRFETIKDDYEAFLSHVVKIIETANNQFAQDINIGIGLPGAICPKTNKFKNSNILEINGKSLKQDLEKRLERAIFLANDADCFALSEALFGAAKEYPSAFGVIIGTGCGGGIVYNKQLVKGPNNVAGEWGHNQLPYLNTATDLTPEPCYCKSTACNELFLSGTGFAARYNAQYGTELTSQQIMAARNESESAKAHYHNYIDQLARALSQVVNVFDPYAIVLGGGMSNETGIYEDLPQALSKYVFGGKCSTPILKAQLGDDSGVKGAAFLCVS